MLGVHIGLRTHHDLSPWKGAGFAMFSMVDSPGMRMVSVWADVAGVDERVSLSGRWEDAGRKLRSLPTPTRTMALARSVASSTLVRGADGSPVAAMPSTTRQVGIDVSRVRVDVMRFTVTTYLVGPVLGFGWLLLVLGLAQLYVTAFVVVRLGATPVLELTSRWV